MYKMRVFLILFLLPVSCSISNQPSAELKTEKPPFSLDELEKRTFFWFWDLAHPQNFQVPDRYPTDNFSSIAATGFGLAGYIIGVERGWVTRKAAAERVLQTLLFLKKLPQGPGQSGVAGYRGFYYHFLDTQNALRFKNVELSSIDTGLLMAGILTVMSYFDHDIESEKTIRETADFLYQRVEWDWFLNKKDRMSMGWFPDRGFLEADWRGYNEAMVLLIMAMGSPTHPAPADMWESWCEPYYRAPFQGQDMVNFGPLFGHQYSQMFIDFRGIKDAYMQEAGFDYFENSRRATLAQRSYCIQNPQGFKGYSKNIWGLTACDGPYNGYKNFQGKNIEYNTYTARGVAADYTNDDGTIAPTAVGGSLPFAPEVCLPALEAMWQHFPIGKYGFFDAYNETFTDKEAWIKGQSGFPYWVDVDYIGIDQGPILLQIENHRSALIWDILKKNKYIIAGLQKAGFKGGWLDEKTQTTENEVVKTVKIKPNPEVPLHPEALFQRKIKIDAQNNTLPYQMMVPQKFALENRKSNQEKFPLVVFLHGSGERGHENHEQMCNGVFAFCETQNLEKYPCYFVVPQCPENNRWASASLDDEQAHFYPDTFAVPGKMVLELIEELLLEYPDIDPNRVYLTGLSMGGIGTFDLLMRRPDLFAAAVPVCGGGDPDYADRIKNIPMWIFHGRLDGVVYPKYSEQMYDALDKAGAKVLYTEYSTLGHFCWNETYYNPLLMEWLFEQRKGF